MALVNPGLGDGLIDCVTNIQALENASGNDTVVGAAMKAILCRNILIITWALDRGDNTNALDYEDADRSAWENHYKRITVGLIATLLQRLNATPVRTWTEVGDLQDILADLATSEDTDWRREIVQLGDAQAITVDRQQTQSGVATFSTPGGSVSAYVYKARTPDVTLDGAWVYLLEMLPDEGDDEPTERYAVMADDPWWGRRIEPAEFAEAPLTRCITMGYRLKGQLLEGGVPAAEENVSLELELTSVHDGCVIAWDSLEYNELIWDSQLATYVEGANVYAPIITDAQGRWEWIAPKGHGAIYQRAGDLRDDTSATAARGLVRHLVAVRQAWRGRKAEVVEGTESVLNILSGTLAISAEPGATLRVGTLDDPGQAYTVPPGGTVTLTGLPEAEHHIVAYKLTAWSTWDQSYGCARQVAQVKRGTTTSVNMGSMECYTDPDVICGRVYERPGVPAAGIAVVLIDPVQCEIIETLGTTDAQGWWEAEVPAGGLGGQPAIHDATWGSLPVLGMPYSDVVLGARVYSAWYETYKPEAWRKPLRGHKNFQYAPGSVIVEDVDSEEQFSTVETAYGGWITSETLPKFKYIADLEQLVWYGSEACVYRILVDGEDNLPHFELRGQPFDDTGSGAGIFRAAGYYPEQKILLGGKIHGNVVRGDDEPIGANLPEAARVGLEFGTHEAFVEARAIGGDVVRAGISDSVCPYCGGPAWRDPDAAYLRGFCTQCANAFQRADAMDCRTYFETPTLGKGAGGYALRFVRVGERDGSFARRVDAHWRPDLYAETADFLTQSGAAQPTNAPRWVAKHVNAMGDNAGFGSFDGDDQEPWTAGHDVDYYEQLTAIDRDLGVCALKLVFAPDYTTPLSYTVEVDCVRADDGIETRTVLVEAGTHGPIGADEFGDALLVAEDEKLLAEAVGSPWAQVGLYRSVSDVRLVSPASAPGCRFTIVNDTPWLASADGVPVENEQATPVAVQLAGQWGSPHLFDDAVGQVFLFYARGGDLFMRTRAGMPADWSDERQLTDEGDVHEPWAGKTAHGELVAVSGRGAGRLSVMRSLDDGRSWEEVR